ncbi:MAG: TetR/AcrR family transcriptional regulator [Chloroflexota bacterium]|nr:TetR/AcrR family transcriptional regulator [Chloroflexota bacterium]
MESSTEAKTYHHGQLREALIAAGLTLLNQEGVAGVDLRKVARMTGVSHAAPYRHFADKRALIAAIAEHGFAQLTAAMQTALGSVAVDDGRGQFLALAQAYVTFALAHPALMREMFSGLTVDRADYPSLYAVSKESFGILWGVIARTFGEPVEQRTVVSFASIHGLALLLIENQLPLSPDKTVEGLVAATIDTLASGFTA